MPENNLQYQLTVLYPPESATTLDLSTTPTILGRSEDSHLALNDEWISRHHCQIWVEDGTIWVEDLKSTNGTFLDGQMIEKQNFHLNSKLQMGKVVLKASCLDNSQQNTISFPNATQPETEPVEEIENTETVETDDDYTLTKPTGELQPNVLRVIEDWKGSIDEKAIGMAFLRISTLELNALAEELGEEAGRFLNLELHDMLSQEKVSDELLLLLEPGVFLFALHNIESDQASSLAEDLRDLIDRQNFQFLGTPIKLNGLIGACFTSDIDSSIPDIWEAAINTSKLAANTETRIGFSNH